MSYLATAGAASLAGALGGYMSIKAGESQEDSYQWKAHRATVAGQRATLEAKLNNTRLQESFNDTQANQVLMGAIQGRSGQTLANIAANDAENLAWDQEFMTLNGIITDAGARMDAAGSKIAAAESLRSGYESAAMGMLNTATSFAKVT